MEMRTIRVIEPVFPTVPPLLRVAAYCRVSTEKEEQECSLKTQIAHFSKLICENPAWEFSGIYAEQKSGTHIKGRHELERLLADCRTKRIDMILMKSISRLSRNTLDALTIYNEVVLRGIELRFELENLSTNDKRVRKMFSTLAAVAQNEGWTRSEDVKWGMRHQANKGKAILNHNRFLGYTKDNARSKNTWRKTTSRLSAGKLSGAPPPSTEC